MSSASRLITERANVFGALMPGADRGAAERQHADRRQRGFDAVARVLHLRGVAAELLAERHGRGVHQVRAARLHDRRELTRLLPQRRDQTVERGQQVDHRHAHGREVDGRREHVVRRLRRVHVVVRMHRAGLAQSLGRERGEHLVHVHVRRRARPGLEDVDRELVVVAAAAHFGGGVVDGLGHVLVDHAEPSVDGRARALDRGQRGDQRRSSGSPEIGKLSTARCVCAPHRASSGTSTSPMLSCSMRMGSTLPTGRPLRRAAAGSVPSARGRLRVPGAAAARPGQHAVPAARRPTACRRSTAAGRTFVQVEPEALTALDLRGDARHRPLPASRAPAAAARHPRRPARHRPTTGSSRSTS